jgi:hypothetical protein
LTPIGVPLRRFNKIDYFFARIKHGRAPVISSRRVKAFTMDFKDLFFDNVINNVIFSTLLGI